MATKRTSTHKSNTGKSCCHCCSTVFTLVIVVLLLFICTIPSRTTTKASTAGGITMAKSNLDSSGDSVLDKSPRRSDKSSTVGTLSKQERNDDKHNQQQSPNTVQTPSGFRDEASTRIDCQIVGSEQTTKPSDMVDVSKRVVKDGGGKLGMYMGACRMTTNTQFQNKNFRRALLSFVRFLALEIVLTNDDDDHRR